VPKPSRVKALPPDIKTMLDRLLREGRETQLAVLAKVNELLESRGEQPLSKSGINRYAQSMERIGARMRQAREVADMWVGELGKVPEGKMGRWLIETIRIMAFEATNALADDETPVPPKALNELAKMARNLELAESTSAQREMEIRTAARKEAEEEMRRKLDEATGRGGFDAEAAEEARRILGFT